MLRKGLSQKYRRETYFTDIIHEANNGDVFGCLARRQRDNNIMDTKTIDRRKANRVDVGRMRSEDPKALL